MSPCLPWEYFLKKLGIRRERTRPSLAIADLPSDADKRQREDFIEASQNSIQVQQLHENSKYDVILLHPDWQRFPHAQIYGWTNDHEEQLKSLTKMIVSGNLLSAYYKTETEYGISRFLNNYTILPGPNVTDVNEAILLLRRNKGFEYSSYCNESLLEYDADDESGDSNKFRENNLRSMGRYWNRYNRPKRHVGERITF